MTVLLIFVEEIQNMWFEKLVDLLILTLFLKKCYLNPIPTGARFTACTMATSEKS